MPLHSNNNALGCFCSLLIVLVTMECELLGAIPTGINVRHYFFAGTNVLDVSHVGNRKNLEKSTRGYSGRCSYASPNPALRNSGIGKISPTLRNWSRARFFGIGRVLKQSYISRNFSSVMLLRRLLSIKTEIALLRNGMLERNCLYFKFALRKI